MTKMWIVCVCIIERMHLNVFYKTMYKKYIYLKDRSLIKKKDIMD